MKNVNFKIMRKFLPMVLLAGLSLMACNKSGGGGGSPAPVAPQGCPTCIGGGAILLPNVKAMTPGGSALFALDLLAQQAVGFCGQPQDKTAICYQGAASFTGTMRITQQDMLICNAPVGDYAVRPLQPSMMGSLIMQGGTYEAVHASGARIVFRLVSGIIMNSTGVSSLSMDNRVYLTMTLDSVNGFPCGQMSAN